ncbi:uncharacterized protein LOC128198569 [Bicyclus anynana]|uniref:Uncharacterized protein LOC128198569 n=1 Tax=Bicyclus anynana TaxID=110368 RepID=A0ABM3LNG8_BICAN|nr:uncharacterized protein LOC128198569 [Bicyclus anynana]
MTPILVLLVIAPGTIATTELITPIVDSPGLYFDNLGILKYYNNFWNIITFTDLSYIKPHVENIKNVIYTVKETCHSYKSAKIQSDCSNTLSPLETLLKNVENNYQSLSHLTQEKGRSKRSSWFGFGGPILKQLFGSLDEDDAQIFTNAINAIQDDQRHLASLMKENIHVISSTISTFNNTIQKLNENEQILNSNIGKLDKILDNVLQTTNKLEASSHLTMTFSALESSLMTLNFNLKDIIDAILFGKQNIVHPSILSPMQLYNELNSNKNKVPQNFPLPLNLENMHILLDISQISSFITDSKIVFVVKIPLVLLQEYNLYHVYALPTAHDINNPHSFAMINPTAKFLAITDDKLLYSMTDSISDCKTLTNNYRLCKLGNVHSSVANPTCEVQILSAYINKIPDTCDYKNVVSDIDVWQTISNNKWIYVQSNIAKLSVKCNNSINDYDIIGTGILKLPKGCTAFHKLLQFSPSVEYETALYMPTPNFNIINDDCCSRKKINSTLPYLTPIKLSHINLDSLHYVTHRLNQVNDEIEKIENQPYHIKYGSYFSVCTTLVSLIVLCYISFKMYKKCCNRRKRNNSLDSSSGCCIQIFNSCYTKPNQNIQAINTSSDYETHNRAFESNSSSENSPTFLRRNLH